MSYQSEELNELAGALAKAQGEMTSAKTDSTNPHYKSKYASLQAVTEAIKEPLSKNGLAYTQRQVVMDGQTYLETRLIHSSGQWMASFIPIDMNLIRNMKSNPIQQYGSLLSYLRRYSLSAIVGIAPDDDDDGNASLGNTVQTKVVQEQQKINPEQIKWIQDTLKFYGGDVEKEFWERLNKQNKYALEDIPSAWYNTIQTELKNIIAKHEGNPDE